VKLNQHIARFLLTVFIGSYSIGIFQSYLPAINDFVQHTFNEFNHINTIHFENGKYHLHKEEAKIIKHKNNKDQNNEDQTVKKLDFHDNNIHPNNHINQSIKIDIIESCFYFSKTLIDNELEAPYPPPQKLV
jgi:hypothetical protein